MIRVGYCSPDDEVISTGPAELKIKLINRKIFNSQGVRC